MECLVIADGHIPGRPYPVRMVFAMPRAHLAVTEFVDCLDNSLKINEL
jgi:hypothetical protein